LPLPEKENEMNKATPSTSRIRFLFGITLTSVGLLTGCTTYVQEAPPPPPPVVYAPEPPPPPQSAVVVVQTQADFYAPLSSYGRWVDLPPYGRCWLPNGVEQGWRPYCDGHWESSDAGWYWVTDEPWGWATYHYGRWIDDPQYGWVWVPQTQWAPAWVVWREGGGYSGWAPMGVTTRIGAGGVFSVGIVAPGAFVYVDERHFLEPVHPTTVIVNQTVIINKTVNITKIQVVNNTVINTGPRTEVIAQATGRQIQTVPVRELRHKQEAAAVARQPQLKALRPAKTRKAGQDQVKPESEHHAAAEANKTQKSENTAAQDEKKPVQKEQKTDAQKAEQEKQQEKRKAAKKKKAQEEEERHSRDQQQPGQ
jgi:hypothetical protein